MKSATITPNEIDLAIKALNIVAKFFINEIQPKDIKLKNSSLSINSSWHYENDFLNGGITITGKYDYFFHPFYTLLESMGFKDYCHSLSQSEESYGFLMSFSENFKSVPRACKEYIVSNSKKYSTNLDKYMDELSPGQSKGVSGLGIYGRSSPIHSPKLQHALENPTEARISSFFRRMCTIS